MFSTGIATIFVTDMDRSVDFYTRVLGLRLTQRFGNQWAQVEAGRLTIGLHPASAKNSAGQDGSTIIGFVLSTPIHDAVSTLQAKGVRFRGDVAEDETGRFAHFEDPDGNLFYMFEIVSWPERESTDAKREMHSSV